MKKSLLILLALFVVFSSAGMLFAAGVGHNINQSAEFIRMPSRNASTDVDAVFYNPAGTTSLSNGLHFYVSNQFIMQGRTIEDDADSSGIPGGTELESSYEGETNVPLFPNIYIVYKMDQMAFFAGFAPVGGGGTAEFADGLPAFYWLAASKLGTELVTGLPASTATGLTNLKQEFEGSSTYLMGQIGAAYQIDQMISVALGLRYVTATEAYKGSVTPTYSTAGIGPQSATQEVDTELTGQSFGAVVGVNLKPMAGLNIGIRYEWYSELELEADTAADDVGMYPDGAKFLATLPQVIGIGVSYQVMPELTAVLSIAYALNTIVDHDGAEDEYRNAADIGIGFEYLIMTGLRASIGYQFGMASETDDGISELSYGNDSHTIGLGARYTIMQGLDASIGFAYVIYADREVDSASGAGTVTLGKDAMTLAIGVSYQAF